MDIAWWRDLVIVVAGASFALATLTITVLALVIAIVAFKRVKKILDSASATAGHIEEVTRFAKEEIAKPMVSMAVIVRGLATIITAFRDYFGGSKRKEKSAGARTKRKEAG